MSFIQNILDDLQFDVENGFSDKFTPRQIEVVKQIIVTSVLTGACDTEAVMESLAEAERTTLRVKVEDD